MMLIIFSGTFVVPQQRPDTLTVNAVKCLLVVYFEMYNCFPDFSFRVATTKNIESLPLTNETELTNSRNKINKRVQLAAVHTKVD